MRSPSVHGDHAARRGRDAEQREVLEELAAERAAADHERLGRLQLRLRRRAEERDVRRRSAEPTAQSAARRARLDAVEVEPLVERRELAAVLHDLLRDDAADEARDRLRLDRAEPRELAPRRARRGGRTRPRPRRASRARRGRGTATSRRVGPSRSPRARRARAARSARRPSPARPRRAARAARRGRARAARRRRRASRGTRRRRRTRRRGHRAVASGAQLTTSSASATSFGAGRRPWRCSNWKSACRPCSSGYHQPLAPLSPSTEASASWPGPIGCCSAAASERWRARPARAPERERGGSASSPTPGAAGSSTCCSTPPPRTPSSRACRRSSL